MPTWIDSHTHIDAPEFEHDRGEVIARARAVGVTRQLVPAVTATSWSHLREVCATYPGLYPAYGLHPMYLDLHGDEDLDALRAWIEREKPCAVGECGLDFFVESLDPVRQRHFFHEQLRIARAYELPVIVHARRAFEEVIHTLREFDIRGGIVHSFGGSAEQARQLHAMGMLIGIGGPLTYERATRLRAIVTELPIEQLVLETDSPDQPLANWRGQRNEPARLIEIAELVAQLRGTTPKALAEATTRNLERCFKLPPEPSS